MKKKNILLILISSLSLILISCNKKDIVEMKIEAVIQEVNTDEGNLLVEDDELLLKDSIIDIKNITILKDNEEITIDNLNVGDRIVLSIDEDFQSNSKYIEARGIILLEKEIEIEKDLKIPMIKVKEINKKQLNFSVDNVSVEQLELINLKIGDKNKSFIENTIIAKKYDIPAGEDTVFKVSANKDDYGVKLTWLLENGEQGEYIMKYEVEKNNNNKTNNKDIVNNNKTEEIKFYFIVFDETDSYLVSETHSIESKTAIARHTLENLRDIQPKTKDAFSPIPKNVNIKGISIKDKVATVNFSKEILKNKLGSSGEILQVQGIVNTLTQFDSIDSVLFEIEGDSDIDLWLSHMEVKRPMKEDFIYVR